MGWNYGDILDHVAQAVPGDKPCLVHGEPGPMDSLKQAIERRLGWTVKTPDQGDTIALEAARA